MSKTDSTFPPSDLVKLSSEILYLFLAEKWSFVVCFENLSDFVFFFLNCSSLRVEKYANLYLYKFTNFRTLIIFYHNAQQTFHNIISCNLSPSKIVDFFKLLFKNKKYYET